MPLILYAQNLAKLAQHGAPFVTFSISCDFELNGDCRKAEMVKAFLNRVQT